LYPFSVPVVPLFLDDIPMWRQRSCAALEEMDWNLFERIRFEESEGSQPENGSGQTRVIQVCRFVTENGSHVRLSFLIKR
jgi:hypothetical protein